MYSLIDLSGRIVLITGASSGIGRACAVEASKLGAAVILVARSEGALRETLSEMESNTRHRVIPFDLMHVSDIEALFDAAVEGGKLTGIVHAAGVCPAVPIQFQPVEEMNSAMTLNYFSFLIMAKHFAKKKYMDGGSVVAISSVSAEAGWKCGALYSGTKGAVSSTVRSLALELVAKKIRVNAVLPSNIDTPLFDAVALNAHDEDGMRRLLERQPLGIGKPADVAHAVMFLLSDASRFITGTNLVVDGGYLAQ